MAVGDAYVFPGFLTPVLTNFSYQSHRLLFSHASAEVRGENTPERKVASTGDRTHNHKVTSPTRSPLSHPGGVYVLGEIEVTNTISFLTHSHTMTPFDAPGKKPFENTVGKGEIAHNEQFLLFPQCFLPIWITLCHFRQI